MKENLDKLFKNMPFSRRGFIKYSSAVAGLYLARQWLKSPSLAFANSNPRVVSVHDSDATNWDYATGYHWQYIDQSVVNDMVKSGIMALTGATNVLNAWKSLIPYQAGEAVVIKVNFNNIYDCNSGDDNDIDAYPETVNAVIDGLTSIGVPANNIWITDPSRGIPNRFINKINNPNIVYYTTKHWYNRNSITDYVPTNSSHASPTTHPPGDLVRPAQIFVDAAHLINIPLLKGHGAGHMTLGMKNHYGSVTFSGSNQDSERNRMHKYLEPGMNPDPAKSILADICNNPHIRDKTRLIIGDGLYGHPITNWQSVARWKIFDNDDPNILFFGIDPIAVDSVMCDFINEEQKMLGYGPVIHSSLHHGAAIGLGVHDHWDSFENKQYSLIDYHRIDLDIDPPRNIRFLR